MILGLGIFLIFTELFGISMAFFTKANKDEKWYLCFIPFAAYFFVNKYIEFSILIVPIKKFGRLMLILFTILILITIYVIWGKYNLDQLNYDCLVQIMCVPIGFMLIVYYIAMANITIELLDYQYNESKWLRFLPFLLITIPFMVFYISGECKNEK